MTESGRSTRMRGRHVVPVLLAALLLAGCASTGTGLELLEGANPVYPEAARSEGIEGHVTLIYDIAVDGRVTELEVLEAEPEGVFEAAAMDAVRTWRYRPPAGGEAVENVASTLEFRLGEAYPDAAPPPDAPPAEPATQPGVSP